MNIDFILQFDHIDRIKDYKLLAGYKLDNFHAMYYKLHLCKHYN